MKKKIAIIGAGPGGLSAGMLLSSRGFDVTVFEKGDDVGGRSARLSLGEYHFDTGPTFLIMKSLLDELFSQCGKRAEDYCSFSKVEPLYQLIYPDGKVFYPGTDYDDLVEKVAKLWPQSLQGLADYYRAEPKKFEVIRPLLSRPVAGLGDLVKLDAVRAIRHLHLDKPLYEYLYNYFKNDEMVYAFAFQAKYIGMSPWDAPSLFSILSWLEHSEGLYHVQGGLNQISSAMKQVIESHGGTVQTRTPVKKIVVDGKRTTGVQLDDGSICHADALVLNADFAWSVHHLFPAGVLKKWSPKKTASKSFSCSALMLYLGLDTIFSKLPHHNIIFSEDYRSYVLDITGKNLQLPSDPSIYVHNPSVMDATLAPTGHSSLYILAPVPNNRAGIVWPDVLPSFKKQIIELVKNKCNIQELESHVRVEKVITPEDWANDYNVYEGAIFNMGHQFSQMLMFRPHNRFEELQRLYLVGGGTHPGSGLPTIYESARISCELLEKDLS
ncbi:MAG: phytoene desaturase [Deltaproteobacteria bacterium]|nr:phytoene desaturase [Deltaproteobacteria bacterium]